jgi:hypothetical protein
MIVAPRSDATTALSVLRDRLSGAVDQAQRLDVFVRVRTAAAVLDKSESMVTYLCRKGALRARRIGGSWMIDRADLERLRSSESSGSRIAPPPLVSTNGG